MIFMNAGDVFYNHVVLDAILPGRTGDKHLYGNIYRDGQIVSQPVQLSDFYMSTQMICHQSILFATRLHQRVLYDCRYSISADFKAVLEMRKTETSLKKWTRRSANTKAAGSAIFKDRSCSGKDSRFCSNTPRFCGCIGARLFSSDVCHFTTS